MAADSAWYRATAKRKQRSITGQPASLWQEWPTPVHFGVACPIIDALTFAFPPAPCIETVAALPNGHREWNVRVSSELSVATFTATREIQPCFAGGKVSQPRAGPEMVQQGEYLP